MYYVIQFLTVHRYPHPINLKTANGPSTADFRKIFEVSQIFPLLCVLYTQLSMAYSLHCSFADTNLSSVGSAGLVFSQDIFSHINHISCCSCLKYALFQRKLYISENRQNTERENFFDY